MIADARGPSPDAGSGMPIPGRKVRLPLFLGLVLSTAFGGVYLMAEIIRFGGISVLEAVILALFAPTFGWITIAFWSALIGFGLQVSRRHPQTLARMASAAIPGHPTTPLRSRTAVVMPVHNEDPDRVLSGLAAMAHGLDRTGEGDAFDLFLLSDTTDPEIARREESALKSWPEFAPGLRPPHYRRRASNEGRKAGNIADFCARWGDAYACMVVLDADSILTGETLVALARAMEANPEAGLIQTVPLPARQHTLFGRLLQFSGELYAPLLATGQAFWQTDTANFWGHNAIVRVKPFREHAKLPVLSGCPPLGGPILSHDFVEAALLRRAGWRVYLLPEIRGSWEEVPGHLLDYATRDRRWAQGSLQHLRLLFGQGFHPLNRLHFLLGAMGYLSSVLWLLILLASTAWVFLSTLRSQGFLLGPMPGSEPLLALWGPSASPALLPLLTITAVLLFLPKVLSLLLALFQGASGFGGRGPLLVSALFEAIFAILLAPIMMLIHSRFVLSILFGRSVSWDAQSRGGHSISWSQTFRRTAGIVGAGAVWVGLTLWISPTFVFWLSPIFAGILLAPLLIRWTSSPRAGDRARRWKLFLVPSETSPPEEFRGVPDPCSSTSVSIPESSARFTPDIEALKGVTPR
jgi:membrane glycosyltransferase